MESPSHLDSNAALLAETERLWTELARYRSICRAAGADCRELVAGSRALIQETKGLIAQCNEMEERTQCWIGCRTDPAADRIAAAAGGSLRR